MKEDMGMEKKGQRTGDSRAETGARGGAGRLRGSGGCTLRSASGIHFPGDYMVKGLGYLESGDRSSSE